MKTRTKKSLVLSSLLTLGLIFSLSFSASAKTLVTKHSDGTLTVIHKQITDGDHLYELKCDGKTTETKAKEGKCGESKATDVKSAKEAKTTEGKCGEGKCGDSKATDVKSEKKAKTTEGKCGEGKCGVN